jgi:hypothetical protein
MVVMSASCLMSIEDLHAFAVPGAPWHACLMKRRRAGAMYADVLSAARRLRHGGRGALVQNVRAAVHVYQSNDTRQRL